MVMGTGNHCSMETSKTSKPWARQALRAHGLSLVYTGFTGFTGPFRACESLYSKETSVLLGNKEPSLYNYGSLLALLV